MASMRQDTRERRAEWTQGRAGGTRSAEVRRGGRAGGAEQVAEIHTGSAERKLAGLQLRSWVWASVVSDPVSLLMCHLTGYVPWSCARVGHIHALRPKPLT